MTLRTILRALVESARSPGGLVLIGWVLTYKLGESVSDALWKPWLQRGLGYPKETLAAWDASWGMPFSIAGSLLGGVVASRIRPRTATLVFAGSRLLPAALQVIVSGLGLGSPGLVVAVTCAEELTGGALTTSMFAFMMSRVDRRIGATHFTALATLEVIGKTPGSLLAGAIAENAGGFPVAFGIAFGLSATALFWTFPLRRSSEP